MAEPVVESYAQAMLGVARAEGRVDQVVDDLFRFARVFEQSEQLRDTLTDRLVPVIRRQAIVEELLAGKASDVTANIVSFVIGAGRARELPDIADRMVAIAAHERAKEVAEVRSAIALTDEQVARLASALSQATGKDVDVRVVLDPSVLGGLVATVGDTVIDGTVRRRLDQLRETL